MKTVQAKIVQVPTKLNGFQYLAQADDHPHKYFWLPEGTPGAPTDVELDDKGTLEYRSTATCGFWVWSNK